ncbi:MAG: leucine-rich repeat protein [Lachnospiraceae bacterium]|nr:leucine-rich repeat protein [Lachnospiraceae bacterium]
MGANRKTGTGRRDRKGRGTESLEGIRRILAVLLAAILLFTAAAPAASGKAEEKENKKGFELYQANFLYQNPGVWGDLTASMMHRMLYQTIQEESGGSFENATKVQTFLNDRDYRFKGMEGLYEQVLLEILQLQIKGGDAQRQTKSAQAWQETLWSAIGSGLDWSSEVADDGAIRSSLQAAFPKLANVIKEGLAKKGLENIGPAVASLMKGANLCLGFSSDVVSCVNSLALYLSLREYQEGTVEMLRIMYREAKDSDLRNAIHTVMEALQALDEEETIKIVKEQGTDLGVNIAATLVETCLMEVLGTAGLIVSGTSLLTNLTLNSSKIAEYYLMLKAQIVVEDAVLGALKYTYNTYTGTYTQACTLNRGVQMMYDAYEHGMDLAIAYAEQVLDKGLFNKFRSKVSSLFGEESGSAEFKKLAKTWQGIITAGRTCFDTAWLLYQEETEECPYMDIIEDPPVLVTGIKIEKTQQILTMTGTNIYLCGAKVVPSNADNKKITYKSSNTSVVKVDELTGRLTPVSPGVASIVAVTDEGGYSAKQDIVVFEREGVSAFEEQQSSIPVPTSPVQKEEKNYREYYEVNGSGVTLKERIPEFMRGNAYYIPAYLDGKPVTEVDFSESQWRQNYSSDNYEQVILPDTVERIADRSFSGMSKVVVKLNDGLKYIGEEAFQGCSAMTDGVLPDTVTEMGARAFERSGLKKVMIPTSLTVIPEGCFKNCYAITELLPGGDEVRLQEIGDSAFEECSNLRTVSIPDTVEVIGERAFAGVATTLIEMPESLIRIEKEAFLNCFTIARGLAGGGVSLDHLILPDGLVEIGDSAFAGCKELDSVSMPDTVRRIGANAFANCTYLDEVVCREAEAGTDTVQSSTIPAEVGDCAFANCRDLKYLELPAAITAIGTNVITCCPNLQTMYWPDTLESLGQQDMMKGYMGDWDDFADLRIYVKPGLKGTAESNTGGSTTASEETVGLLPDAVFRYEVSARKEETEAGAGSTVYTSCLRYLEIPAAFGKNFRLDAFYYGAKIPEIVVMGPIENVIPGEFVTDYSWVVYQTLSCLDEEGNRVVLYQRPDPSPYTKRSKAESEEAADYAVTIAEETTSVVSQEVLGRTVRINADAATVSGIGGRKLTVFG